MKNAYIRKDKHHQPCVLSCHARRGNNTYSVYTIKEAVAFPVTATDWFVPFRGNSPVAVYYDTVSIRILV